MKCLSFLKIASQNYREAFFHFGHSPELRHNQYETANLFHEPTVQESYNKQKTSKCSKMSAIGQVSNSEISLLDD